jgi:hypothetical protein
MEGRGVVNYDLDRTTYAVSAETSEFDDALIQRGIITFQEAMMRKGVSQDVARELEAKKFTPEIHSDSHTKSKSRSINQHSDNIDSDSDDEDPFFLTYRRKRIDQLTQGRFSSNSMQMISRGDWTHQVNEASHNQWVIVCLTSSDRERTGKVEDAVQVLALKFESVKFVGIPYHQAIENWPVEHLPTLFLYRYGILQHQFISLPSTSSPSSLELTLTQIGVLKADSDSVNKGFHFSPLSPSSLMSYNSQRNNAEAHHCEFLDDIENYDNVD